jgi:hypothetical protein
MEQIRDPGDDIWNQHIPKGSPYSNTRLGIINRIKKHIDNKRKGAAGTPIDGTPQFWNDILLDINKKDIATRRMFRGLVRDYIEAFEDDDRKEDAKSRFNGNAIIDNEVIIKNYCKEKEAKEAQGRANIKREAQNRFNDEYGRYTDLDNDLRPDEYSARKLHDLGY